MRLSSPTSGKEGYCVNTELRAGKQHCQKGTPDFLRRALTFARAITSLPLLVRMDGGNDSQDNLQVCLDPEIKADFIIKRNLRKETPEAWLAVAKENGNATVEREGKTVYRGHQMVKIEGADTPVRLVYKVTERTILRSGQLLWSRKLRLKPTGPLYPTRWRRSLPSTTTTAPASNSIAKSKTI